MANTVINTPELLNLDSTTGATVLAKGTVNERPATPTFSVDYLVVAGGGSSGAAGGGGGGGGGLRTSYGSVTGGGGVAESALNLTAGTSYTWNVGAGGAGVVHANIGNDGSQSTFSSITSTGGGGGGAYPPEGRSGGSGGGCGQSGQRSGGGSGAGGSASSPTQGYPGGSKPTTATVNYVSAGGGGAGAAGGDVPSDVTPGAGGVGLAVNILNSTNATTASVGEVSGGNVYYAGGGGGSNESSSPGAAGGLGGGTNGAAGCPGTAPLAGVANTGGGNGGTGGCGSAYSTGGGSGVIILRYPSIYTATVTGTQASGSPFTEGSDKVSVFTAGTGTISFSGTVVGDENEATDGALRFNTDTNKTEYFGSTGWYEIVDEYASGFIGPGTNYFDTKLYTGNGATQSIGGYINGSGSFNGSSSYIDLGNNSSNNSSVISVSLWFKTAGHSSAATLINNGGANSGETGYYLGLNSNGTIKFEAGTGTVNGAVNYADSQWHQIVLTLNSGAYNIYADGNTTPVITGSGAFTTTATRPTWIGRFSYTPSALEFFEGSIDQVRLYNVALSSSDVAALNLETAATATTAAFPSGQTATATYTMDTSANGLLTTTDLSTVDYPAGTGCIALYEMNGNSNDTNNTYNGTPTNITYEGGAFDQAAVFNGSSSYIDTGLTWGGSSQISWSGWVNTAGGINQYLVADFNSSGANASFRFAVQFHSSNVLYVGTNNSGGGSGTFINFGSITNYLNKWTHVAVTVNGTEVKAYLDGSLFGTGTGTALAAGANPFVIGAYTAGSSRQNFNGLIDQVRIFNTALTQSQVTTLARGIATSYSGAATNVNFNGHLDFQPDFVWIKSRTNPSNGIYHTLMDSVRGQANGFYKSLFSNSTDQEDIINGSAYTQAVNGGVSSFDTNGFTLSNGSGASDDDLNVSSYSYVAWNWKAGGAAVSNTDGTITTQVSANVDAGFSIVQYTAAGNQSFGHGLSQAPELIIQKLYSTTSGWYVYSAPTGLQKYLQLNSTAALGGPDSTWITAVTNATFTANWSGNSHSYINYCFHSVAGYSKIGSYTGNGSATGPTVYTTDDGTPTGSGGFEPSFVMIKSTTDNNTAWNIFDSSRNPTNPRYNLLQPQLSSAEIDLLNTFGLNGVDFLSNGFQLKDNNASRNALNSTYLYMAFA